MAHEVKEAPFLNHHGSVVWELLFHWSAVKVYGLHLWRCCIIGVRSPPKGWRSCVVGARSPLSGGGVAPLLRPGFVGFSGSVQKRWRVTREAHRGCTVSTCGWRSCTTMPPPYKLVASLTVVSNVFTVSQGGRKAKPYHETEVAGK